jgi:hypothetical protein
MKKRTKFKFAVIEESYRSSRVNIDYYLEDKDPEGNHWCNQRILEDGHFEWDTHGHLVITGTETSRGRISDCMDYNEFTPIELGEFGNKWEYNDSEVTEVNKWYRRTYFTLPYRVYHSKSRVPRVITMTAPITIERKILKV